MDILVQTSLDQDVSLAKLAGEVDPLDYITRRLLSYLDNVCQEAEGMTKQEIRDKFFALSLPEQQAMLEKASVVVGEEVLKG